MSRHEAKTEILKNSEPIAHAARLLNCVPFNEICDDYAALENSADSLYGMHQKSLWTRHWHDHVTGKIFVLSIHENGKLVFALPFEITCYKGTCIGRYVGGIHANANFPLMDQHAQAPSKDELLALKKMAKKLQPELSAFILERQLTELEGVKNPLVQHCLTIRSPNLALSASLEGGFDGVLSRVSGSKRMKRHRQQGRRLAEFGPVEFKVVTEADEIETTLDTYLRWKAKQLAAMGAPNTFAGKKMRAFMLANYLESAECARKGGEAHFALQVLKVADKPYAILGTCLVDGGISIEIMAHYNDHTNQLSSGEYLICESIQNACERELLFYDLGLGDQRYKRSWCRQETWHYDTVMPLSVYGHILQRYQIFKNSVKSYIKSNQRLWAYASKIRSMLSLIRRTTPD